MAFDRPGFGGSEHGPARTLRDISAVVTELADHLEHARLPVIGVSCGIGPMDIQAMRQGQRPVLGALFSLARLHPLLGVPIRAMDWPMFRKKPERAVRILSRMLTQPDQELLNAHRDLARIFGLSLAEAYRRRLRGPMWEAALIGRQRPYALSQMAQPVAVFRTADDRRVQVPMGRYIASSVPDGRFHLCETDGRLSVLVHRFSSSLSELHAA